MEDDRLEALFRKFLFTKGYSENNLISQTIINTVKGALRIDLAILDLENKEYIAIIEFSTLENDKLNEYFAIKSFSKYFELRDISRFQLFL